MVVIVKMLDIFANKKKSYNYFSHTLLVMIFPMDKGPLNGLINDSVLKQSFSTSILVEDSRLRFTVITTTILFLGETADMYQERSKVSLKLLKINC